MTPSLPFGNAGELCRTVNANFGRLEVDDPVFSFRECRKSMDCTQFNQVLCISIGDYVSLSVCQSVTT